MPIMALPIVTDANKVGHARDEVGLPLATQHGSLCVCVAARRVDDGRIQIPVAVHRRVR